MSTQDFEIKLTDTTSIHEPNLVIQASGKRKIYLGNTITSQSLIVRNYWKPLIELIQKPTTVKDIAKQLAHTDPHHFSETNANTKVKIFLLFLIKFGLLTQFKLPHKNIRLGSALLFPNLGFIGKILLHPILVSFYIFTILFSLTAPLIHQRLLPLSMDFFWHPYISLTLLTYFVFSSITVLIHESAHFLVAQAFGIKGAIRLSHRLYYLVIETYYPDSFKATSLQKIYIFSAGIVADFVVLTFIYVFIMIAPYYSFFGGYTESMMRQLAIIQWFSILWQGLFFMRTDIYFIFREIIGEPNLYDHAKAILFHWLLRKPLPKQIDNTTIFVYLYAFFLLLGSVFASFRYLFFHLPVIFWILYSGTMRIVNWYGTNNYLMLVDGVLAILVELSFMMVLIVSIMRRTQRAKALNQEM